MVSGEKHEMTLEHPKHVFVSPQDLYLGRIGSQDSQAEGGKESDLQHQLWGILIKGSFGQNPLRFQTGRQKQ